MSFVVSEICAYIKYLVPTIRVINIIMLPIGGQGAEIAYNHRKKHRDDVV